MAAKILLLDIETSPNLAAVWGKWGQNIGDNQWIQMGSTLCWAAKWYDEDETLFASEWDHGEEQMLKLMWDLLDEADAVVHYNGTKFDMPTLNREFLRFGMPPPMPYKEIDLLKVVRKRFRFISNRLDFIAEQLGLGNKLQHKGMDMWFGCMNGSAADQKVMEEYNIQDITLLQDVYETVMPWIQSQFNAGLWIDLEDPKCTNCGSTHLHKKGLQYTKTMMYQRYRCVDCKTPLRARTRHEAKEGILVSI